MDFNKLVTRAKNILLTPKTEWPVIAEEPATIGGIYTNYVVILAAIPAIASFLGTVLITRFLGFGFGFALTSLIVGYALALGVLYVIALIADALAPGFGGQKDQVQAFKLCAYAFTASWVAGIAQILPLLGTLVALAGLVYGIYLLYLGAPHTVKVPQDRAPGYVAVVIIIAIVMNFIVAGIVGTVVGGGALMRSGMFSSVPKDDKPTFDEDSALGKLEQFGKEMEKAGKQLEAAEKSGDQQAQGAALQNMMGTLLSGGQGTVESLPTERIKPFVPASLGGLSRESIEVSRNNTVGLQVSTAKASYRSEGESGHYDLKITDAGGARALLGLASWAQLEEEKESSSGYEKTYKDGGRMIHEKWDRDSSTGEYSIVIADRFVVEVRGHAKDIGELKSALHDVDLAGLEALKGEGAKPN